MSGFVKVAVSFPGPGQFLEVADKDRLTFCIRDFAERVVADHVKGRNPSDTCKHGNPNRSACVECTVQ